MRTQKIFAVALALVLVFSLVPAGVTSAASSSGTRIDVTTRGTTTFTAAAKASEETLNDAPDTLLVQAGNSIERDIPRGAGVAGAMTLQAQPALTVPVASSYTVSTKQLPVVTGWKGLTHVDQRLANNGNQFSLEPPDQGLCAGGGYVLEAVNDVMAVYDTKGNVLKGVTDLNTFYGYPAQIVRTTTPVYGPFVTDPKCMFDSLANRWFLTVLTLDQDPATGAFTGNTHVDIAVSKTKDPTGTWNLYSLNTTNGDGTLPGHPGCPCLGDQPLIGFNQDAFIVSTNEFSVFGPEFNGAQIYALPKFLLELGKPAYAIHFDQLSLAEGPAYSVQPAFPNSAFAMTPQAGGTEFFLSALDFNANLDNRIALWSLTGTRSLYTFFPHLALNYTILASETYGQPPAADQKAGPYPLGQSLGDQMNTLNTNDDRMNQVQYANGKLYSGVNTILSVDGVEKAGIAYFVVAPTVKDTQPVGKIVKQGYVAVANNNVLFPSIAASWDGQALMTFSLAGPDYFPSAAFTSLNSHTIYITGAGTEPADGFTGYTQYGGNGVERWGDYSAAVTDGRTIWMAAEYIPGGPRTSLANWGTFVFGVKP